MRIANRFAIGVHILSLLDLAESGEQPATSEWMAGSIGVNPVIIRNVTGMLRRNGLVQTRQGVAGAVLARPLDAISLLDVYRAVEEAGELFSIHPRPNPDCSIGAHIQAALTRAFDEAQQALEERLGRTTVAQIVRDIRAASVRAGID